ncbi:MAG TPA: IPT/TIG domain-containing protein [Candidatus Acidoferrum sp.]|nr:IPT/TIG domain-containing protein [Candidatus Acidoferrum sp.]
MSNPFSNPQTSSRMERIVAATRDALRRMNLAGGPAKSSLGWMIALVVCALLVGGISLTSIANKRQSKSAKTLTASAAPDTKATAASAKLEEKPIVKGSENAGTKGNAKKHLASVNNVKIKRDTKPEIVAEKRTEPGIRLRPAVQLSPSQLDTEVAESEQESGDEVRQRASWFFDQRAYPNKHIPADALQKAIEQRESMRQQQRAAFKPAAGAQAIVSFPGDALWHLMGPQPINTPFGQNSGFPTASGRVTAIAVDPTNANIVYIGGAAGGVWRTTDGGITWTPLTDSQPALAIGSIAIDPNSCTPTPCSTIYVGTGEDNFNGDAFYGAGILKSTNGGTTWTQLGASIFAGAKSSGVGGGQIGGIAVQPGNSSIVLASVFFFDGNDANGGVWRSTDGGTTWVRPTTGAQGSAGTGVFFESTINAGATATAWAALGDIFPPSPASNGIWKSTDSGATWTKQAGGLPTVNLGRITLGYAQSTSGAAATIYAAIADSSTTSSNLLGLFKTGNGGTAWTSVTGPAVTGGFCAHQCFYDMAIGVSPTNQNVVVLGGGAGPDNFTSLFESTNGGTSWTPATAAAGDFSFGSTSTHPHVDTHALVFSANGAILYVGNDGGVWSTNTPTPASGVSPTWSDLNAGLAITQFYPGPTAAVSDENYGFGGTQDNDVELFQNSLTWQNEFICGDGGFTAIDQTTPSTIYATCDAAAGAKVKKAVMNGQFLTFANTQQFPGFDVAETAITGSGDHMQFIPPIALDDNNPENLYFGTCRVWQTTNAASSLANSFLKVTPAWTPISGDLSNGNAAIATSCPSAGGGGNITTVDVGHSNSNLILAGTSNGKVWETTTGGILWNQIDHGLLPPRHVTAVRTQRNDSTGNIAYVALSGFGSCAGCGATPGHIFATTNGGTSWTNISGDLPDIPVNDVIAYHQGSPAYDALYIATDVGVFSCPNPAATLCANWTVIGDGLPNSPVLGLAMRRSTRILRAATHGRSTWQIQLTDVSPPPLASINSITPAAVNVGAATTAITINGLNFSTSTQVQFAGSSTGVTTSFVNTTQLNVTLSNTLFTVGGVFPITLTDPAGVDLGSSLLTGGGAPFAVMNPLLDPLTMTPTTALTYTAVPFHLTSATATEPFLPNTVLAFYDTSNPPVLQFQLPTVPTVGTVSGGGTVYDLTTAVTQFTTPFTYQVVPYNPPPGGGIDDLALTVAAGGPVPFTFTVTANPGPVVLVNPNPIVLGPIAVGANTSITTFQIQNPGSTNALHITNATFSGANAANFVFVAPTLAPTCTFEGAHTVTVVAGASCFFGVKYTAGTPPGNANSVATLNIADDAPGSPQAISVTGLVLSSTVVVAVSPVNFGAVAIGTTSPTMNATLINLNSVALNVNATGFTISGANASDFHFTAAAASGNPACPALASFALAANSLCDVGLNFTPSVASAENATINVADDGPGSPQNAPLIGVGVQITSISPSIVSTGGPAFTLTVNGGGFASSAIVNVNGSARLTTFVSANQLLASIPASDIAAAGSLAISVTTPVPGGVQSAPKTLVVAQAFSATNDDIHFATVVNPAALPFRVAQDTTQDTPNTGGVNDPAVSCGSNSVARSVWFSFKPTVSGRVIADTRFSSYTTILSAWTGSIGSLSAVAGACATGNVPAAGASPVESFIGFNVTANTQYFIMVTDANTNGPGGTLTFTMDFASAAPANDAFGSATVASVPFSNTVNTVLATPNTGATDPTPSCAPVGAASGGMANSVWYTYTPTSSGTLTADTLTSPYETILTAVTGAPGSFAQVACNQSAGAGIAQSQVSFAATSGTTYFFMVSSFLGDGGTTNFHLTFSASASNPVPTITSFSPTSATAGSAAFALTINGTNFVSGATGTFNGAARTVTFVSATQVTMAVTAPDIAAAGSFPVIVSNPAPGGGPSAPMNFLVNNPVPTTTSISPTSATAGGAGFTLTVNGTNFNASSVVNFNGAPKTTTFVNATQITATILAADIATAGSVNVTVTNPAPGGGTSGVQTFTINNPVPTITSLSPTGATAGGAAFTLTVNGTGFVGTSSVKFNGTARVTTFVSATQVTAAILMSDIASAGTPPVTVTNPAPGGGTSNAVNFNVSAANNPVPTITSLSPTSATAGGAAFTLTINGTNFIAVTTGTFNGTARTITFVSATQVTMAVTAADIASGGTFPVVVSNPAPGGGASAPSNFTVNNPAPTITSLSPTSATAGGGAFTLTVNGTGFVPTSAVNFNGAARTTTFVNATQVTAAITAADIATAGTFPVTVTNTAPGGGTSTASNFIVNNPAPTITSLSPTSATVGGAAFTLTVNGTGFVSTSSVKFNGNAKTTTFVNATQVTAAITAADIAAAGTFPVTVTNSAPGGGTSAATNFTVNNPVPTITSLVPSSATAGGVAFTLTVNGTNFVSGASATFNGTARTTTFVNATQVTVAVTAPDIAAAGTFPVVVTNPAPGGGASAASNFTVNNPLPTITSLSPTGATSGGAAFTLTVNGTGFVANSSVSFNGSARTTTFVSATQVTAAILMSDIASAGTPPITVTNPAPGGGTSNAVNFNVSAANNPVPTLTSISPTSATAGTGAFTLTLTGTNFVANSTVSFGANPPLVPTSQTATQLQVTVPAADIATGAP